MKFEYHTFDVEPYLASRVQPSFAFPRMTPAANYYTLADPETGEAAFTRGNGEVVRIPVFGVSTQPLDPAEDLSRADHGSLLTALGMEVILKFVNRLPPHPPISRAVVVLLHLFLEDPLQPIRREWIHRSDRRSGRSRLHLTGKFLHDPVQAGGIKPGIVMLGHVGTMLLDQVVVLQDHRQ